MNQSRESIDSIEKCKLDAVSSASTRHEEALPDVPCKDGPNAGTRDLPKASVELLEDEKIKAVLNSDSALDALLKRLKESINSCEEFAKFIKKKSAFQEEYDYQVRKLAKNTSEYLKHNAAHLRQDSFTSSFEQIVNFDDRLHNVGYAYVTALQTMSDELFQLSATMQRQRRSLKEEGKRHEKGVCDAIQAAEKAKSRYDNLCIELEKVRTNEPIKKFSLKSKTASQQEEELLVKIESADKDYSSKVAVCKRMKDDLLHMHRPANCKALKDVILELDLAVSVQLQKYVTWCENLIMNSGVLISPLRADARQASMKNVAAAIDNERDLYDYLVAHAQPEASRGLIPVEYKVHPTLVNTQANFNKVSHSLSFASNIKRSSSILLKKKGNTSPVANNLLKVQEDHVAPTGSDYSSPGMFSGENRSQSALPSAFELSSVNKSPDAPVIFGGSIDKLCIYEHSTVPLVVRTCINIIDTYGLDLEGIYRTSGNSTKIQQLKDALNADRSIINKLITNPDNIIDSDMYCIASLLKLYFAQLPEPLLPTAYYKRLLDAVKIVDFPRRKKILHEVIYELPDANYFTLRALIFHLCRVAEKEEINRMSARNLGIIWGPNLLPSNHTNAEDMSYQGKVVENLMYIVADVFDPEDEDIEQ